MRPVGPPGAQKYTSEHNRRFSPARDGCTPARERGERCMRVRCSSRGAEMKTYRCNFLDELGDALRAYNIDCANDVEAISHAMRRTPGVVGCRQVEIYDGVRTVVTYRIHAPAGFA